MKGRKEMKAYKVGMMDRNSYHALMTGSYDYDVEYVEIIADNPTIALQKAELLYPHMIIRPTAWETELNIPCEDQLTIADLLG